MDSYTDALKLGLYKAYYHHLHLLLLVISALSLHFIPLDGQRHVEYVAILVFGVLLGSYLALLGSLYTTKPKRYLVPPQQEYLLDDKYVNA